MKQRVFEEKIKPVLTYVGAIGAGLMCVAYVMVVFVLIFGFQITNPVQSIVFAVVNAAVGLIIMQFLKIQGISFAKELPENQKVLAKFNKNKKKTKKHSIKHYWITSIFSDILSKGVMLALTTVGVITIVIAGSNDYMLLLLAAVNLVMFVCFGLMSLVNAYDAFNNDHIPYLEELAEEREKLLAEENKDNDTNKHNKNEQGDNSTQPRSASTVSDDITQSE